jgi:hypothetical protein
MSRHQKQCCDWQHCPAHRCDNIRSLAEQRKEGSAHRLKQRGVIVKNVLIRKQPVRPGPDHVKMLRFIGVPGLVRNVKSSQAEQNQEKYRPEANFDWRQLEERPASFRQPAGGTLRRLSAPCFNSRRYHLFCIAIASSSEAHHNADCKR